MNAGPTLKWNEGDAQSLRPKYLPRSAWIGHGPFAMWLVQAIAPRVIVELGTHNGYSYFSMCQAIKDAGLQSKAYAVDTWQGDDHAGFYSDQVYQVVALANQPYENFSTLLRKRFDQALPDIAAGSVDLLHVDSRHGYEDVKEDFESWIPKLSDRAIVLFHDTEVLDRGFGVYKYWAELTKKHTGFAFRQSHGLGVLFFGANQTDAAKVLIGQASTPEGIDQLRQRFVKLGRGTRLRYVGQRAIQRIASFFQVQRS